MGKPTICIGENKGADQLRGNAKLISAFVFATRIVQFLFYVNPKFQASRSFLCLYRLVCVGPVRKPQCWFSHEAAHIIWHGCNAVCNTDPLIATFFATIFANISIIIFLSRQREQRAELLTLVLTYLLLMLSMGLGHKFFQH